MIANYLWRGCALAFSFSLFTVNSIAALQDPDAAYRHLDQLACEAGTDKSSEFHHYTRVYADYFEKIRHLPLKFLEIGVYHGASGKMWEKYFPNGELHFIDIDLSRNSYFAPNAHYHLVDQGDRPSLRSFISSVGGDFDIIIDDGGHRVEQQITSFEELFPTLKPGGIYVIEDLHTSYWREYGGHGKIGVPRSGPGTAVEFLKGLVDDLNYTAAVCECADLAKVPPNIALYLKCYEQEIESIHFYKSLCIVVKSRSADE